jgi:hypothetical protein
VVPHHGNEVLLDFVAFGLRPRVPDLLLCLGESAGRDPAYPTFVGVSQDDLGKLEFLEVLRNIAVEAASPVSRGAVIAAAASSFLVMSALPRL